jgi:hypothetical protein
MVRKRTSIKIIFWHSFNYEILLKFEIRIFLSISSGLDVMNTINQPDDARI